MLIADNMELMKKNQYLVSRQDSVLINKVIEYMNQYDEINKKIYKKYIELNRLKWIGLKTNFIYRWKFFFWKVMKRTRTIQGKLE